VVFRGPALLRERMPLPPGTMTETRAARRRLCKTVAAFCSYAAVGGLERTCPYFCWIVVAGPLRIDGRGDLRKRRDRARRDWAVRAGTHIQINTPAHDHISLAHIVTTSSLACLWDGDFHLLAETSSRFRDLYWSDVRTVETVIEQ